MRIIAGKFGGLQIVTPKGHRTHPMSERVRGALFNSLGDITGYEVLDAFAGTGVLAFEAISRGASMAIAVDNDKKATSAMKESIEKLGIAGSCRAIQANISGWSNNNPEQKFDLVFLDPPYDKLQTNLLDKISRHVANDGQLVVSWPGKSEEEPRFDNFKIENVKEHGDAKLLFYRRV
jgi:16S rRNA (guanine966-N2)-methyltransferase